MSYRLVMTEVGPVFRSRACVFAEFLGRNLVSQCTQTGHALIELESELVPWRHVVGAVIYFLTHVANVHSQASVNIQILFNNCIRLNKRVIVASFRSNQDNIVRSKSIFYYTRLNHNNSLWHSANTQPSRESWKVFYFSSIYSRRVTSKYLRFRFEAW